MPDNASKTPTIRRVSFSDHLAKATAANRDRDAAGRVAAAAGQLPPLHAIQVATDQVVRKADDLAAGIPDPYGKGLGYHLDQTIGHIEHHRDVLRAAADAADAMIGDLKSQMTGLERHMSKKDQGGDLPAGARPEDQQPPQLTTSGEPHPLVEAGYDPAADPQLPPNISDVEALKEGKATFKQTEAINESADINEDQGKGKAAAPKGAAPKGATPAKDTGKGK